jgi:hypothetical protein
VERELTLNYKTLSGFNFENQPFDVPYTCSRQALGAVLCLSENNPGLAHIVRRDLDFHFVTGHDADEVFPHFSADMGKNLLAVWQRHPKHRIGKDFGDRTLDNQRFLLRHTGNCLDKVQFSNGIGFVLKKVEELGLMV